MKKQENKFIIKILWRNFIGFNWIKCVVATTRSYLLKKLTS